MLWFTVPTPSPVPSSGVADELVTPGVWGFVITFLLIVAVVLLIFDMVRRIRRVTYRAQVKEQLEAEVLEAEALEAEALEAEALAAEAAALADEPRAPARPAKLPQDAKPPSD